MTLSRVSTRVLRVLQETGPRPLTIISGFAKGSKKELERIVGELFIAGVVEWKSSKRWRQLAARTRKA